MRKKAVEKCGAKLKESTKMYSNVGQMRTDVLRKSAPFFAQKRHLSPGKQVNRLRPSRTGHIYSPPQAEGPCQHDLCACAQCAHSTHSTERSAPHPMRIMAGTCPSGGNDSVSHRAFTPLLPPGVRKVPFFLPYFLTCTRRRQ